MIERLHHWRPTTVFRVVHVVLQNSEYLDLRVCQTVPKKETFYWISPNKNHVPFPEHKI